MSFITSGTGAQKRNYNWRFGDTGGSEIVQFGPGFDLAKNFDQGGPSGGYAEVNNRLVFCETAGGGATRTAVAFGEAETGKYYVEFTCVIGNGCFMGWMRSAAVPSNLAIAVSSAAGGFYINPASDQFVTDVGTFPLGAVGAGTYMFALDLTNSRHWIGKNGVWLTGDPSTDTTPFFTSALTLGAPSARTQCGFGTSSARILSLESELLFPLPTGFASWAV